MFAPGHARPGQAMEIWKFPISPLDFFEFLQWIIFPFSSGYLCCLAMKSPQNVEKIALSLGSSNRVKNPVMSLPVSGCHRFFGPDLLVSQRALSIQDGCGMSAKFRGDYS